MLAGIIIRERSNFGPRHSQRLLLSTMSLRTPLIGKTKHAEKAEPPVPPSIENQAASMMAPKYSSNASRLSNSTAQAEISRSNAKRQPDKHTCAVCSEEVATSQFKKFSTCNNGVGKSSKCNKTCNYCWTKHLKIQLIEHPVEPVQCFECGVSLDLEEVLDKQKLLPRHEREQSVT